MLLSRALRVTATSAVLALAVGAATTTAAEAKPTRPGPVTGLAVVATEPAIGTYQVDVTWIAVANATSYSASISRAGTTVATTKVTAPATSWSRSVPATPGQTLTVTVTAAIGHFKGKSATKSVLLLDTIAPTATYAVQSNTDTGEATLTETGLTDDSALSGVTRTVTWGDGSSNVYATGDPITHTYALTEARYVPHVTLKDAANNTTEVDAAEGVVVADHQAPTGSFAVSRTAAWATYSKVAVSQTAVVADNWTPGDLVTRTVDWNDGTPTQTWSGTTPPPSHVYAVAGSFAPVVTMTDEAGNHADVTLDTVTVKVDSVGPRVTLLLPKSKHSVRAFRTLKGKATDTGGTGVARVTLKAVEKRGTVWYGYNATTKTWLKAATKTKAFAKARAAVVRTTSTHVWAVTLKGLRKGTLVYKVFAKDKVANKSATITHKAALTRR